MEMQARPHGLVLPGERVVKVAINEWNQRLGEHHPRATISDELVEQMRCMHEDGLGYRRIARLLNLRVWTVRDIVAFRRRNVVPHTYVEVEVKAPSGRWMQA